MLRCYIAEVLTPHENDDKLLLHSFFARISKDGRVKMPTEARGPTIFASYEEIILHIDRATEYRERAARFGRMDERFMEKWEFRPVPVFVPVRTAIFRHSFEIPLEALA